MSKSDGGEPDQQCAQIGPDPSLFKNRLGSQPHGPVRLINARAASTMMRMAPSAPTCQSGEIRIKLRSVPARVRVSAPITAPIGDTRPPTNSPPPRITPAIESSVYPLPMLASAEVVRPIKARPAKTPKTPAKLNITTLVFSNDQPARPIASGLPPEPRRMAPYEVGIRPRGTRTPIRSAGPIG